MSPLDDLDFMQSITNAEAHSFKVAWSNDTFEVWILLHFEEIPVGEQLHRTYLYERLTEIFKTLPPRSAAQYHITSNPTFNFKHFSKRRDHFINFIRPRLIERMQTAIQNALNLEQRYAAGDIAFHDQNPCIKVHQLVLAIFENPNAAE